MEDTLAPIQYLNLSSFKYLRMPNQDMVLGLQPSKEALRDGIIYDDQLGNKNVMIAPRVVGGGLK